MNSIIAQFKKQKKAIKKSLVHRKKPTKKEKLTSINEIEIEIDPEKIIEREKPRIIEREQSFNVLITYDPNNTTLYI